MPKALDILLPVLGGLAGTDPALFRGIMAARGIAGERRRGKDAAAKRERDEADAQAETSKQNQMREALQAAIGQGQDPQSQLLGALAGANPSAALSPTLARLSEQKAEQEKIAMARVEEMKRKKADFYERSMLRKKRMITKAIGKSEAAGQYDTANELRSEIGLVPLRAPAGEMPGAMWDDAMRKYGQGLSGPQVSEQTGIPLDKLPWKGLKPAKATEAADTMKGEADIATAQASVMSASVQLEKLSQERDDLVKQLQQPMMKLTEEDEKVEKEKMFRHHGQLEKLIHVQELKIDAAQKKLAMQQAKIGQRTSQREEQAIQEVEKEIQEHKREIPPVSSHGKPKGQVYDYVPGSGLVPAN